MHKIKLIKVKSLLDGLKSRLDTAKENISKLDRPH